MTYIPVLSDDHKRIAYVSENRVEAVFFEDGEPMVKLIDDDDLIPMYRHGIVASSIQNVCSCYELSKARLEAENGKA